jgi:hypothetical protein
LKHLSQNDIFLTTGQALRTAPRDRHSATSIDEAPPEKVQRFHRPILCHTLKGDFQVLEQPRMGAPHFVSNRKLKTSLNDTAETGTCLTGEFHLVKRILHLGRSRDACYPS